MKKELLILLLFLSPLAVLRCGTEADYDILKQDTTFRDFLRKYDIPYDASLAGREGLYKAVWPAESPGDTVCRGDTVFISYSGFLFAQDVKTLGQGAIFTTNIKADLDPDWDPGNLLLMPTAPLSFVVGEGQTLRGIDRGIEECAEGDTVRLYLTSDWAYGDKAVGYLAPGTPVVFRIYVDEVKKTGQ